MTIKVPKKLACIVIACILGIISNSYIKNNNNIDNLIKKDDLSAQEEMIDSLYTEDSYASLNNNELQIFEELKVKTMVFLKNKYKRVNLKTGPGDSFEYLGVLDSGISLPYKGEYENGWIEVYYDTNQSAYVNSKYVNVVSVYDLPNKKTTSCVSKSIIDNLIEIDVVKANRNLNIRKSPTSSSRRIGILPKNQTLPIIGETNNGWYKIDYNDGDAYVSGDYVTVIKKYTPKQSLIDIVEITKNTYLIDLEAEAVIGDVPKLEIAEVFGENNDYYFVRCDEMFGFISKCDTKSLGDNYVIIDISDQTLSVYNDDKLVVRTSVVTGKDLTPTNLGSTTIGPTKRNTNLIGPDYNVAVEYWMPINKTGEGIHDASWRRSFGGKIYHKKGSHGCINVPKDIMPLIYYSLNENDKSIVKR